MKKSQVLVFAASLSAALCATLCVTTSGFAAPSVTKSEAMQACRLALREIPTETGRTIPFKDCLEFDFNLIEETPNFKVIEMLGATIEDMTTVCTVYLLKDPTIEIAVPRPSCELT